MDGRRQGIGRAPGRYEVRGALVQGSIPGISSFGKNGQDAQDVRALRGVQDCADDMLQAMWNGGAVGPGRTGRTVSWPKNRSVLELGMTDVLFS